MVITRRKCDMIIKTNYNEYQRHRFDQRAAHYYFIALAFNVPFGLFIFSYVLLGPLHYLTEINWLREKSYFVKNRQWIGILAGFGLLISLPFFFNAELWRETRRFYCRL
jgi:hypothetical protein